MSNRRAKAAKQSTDDRLPPNSIENEQGVIGCVLLENACLRVALDKFQGRPVWFDLRHDIIWGAMVRMESDGQAIDILTLKQFLDDAGELDQAGGIAYINSLQDIVPSVQNISNYAQIVFDKYELRSMIQTCSHFSDKAYNHSGHIDELKVELRHHLSRFDSTPAVDCPRFTVKDLMSLDMTDMSDVLLGNDWINKGGSCLISAASGIGKSVLQIQMAIFWAVGRPIFSVKPQRPLKSVILYAENHQRDNRRALAGVLSQLGINAEFTPEEFELVNKNVVFRECYSVSGQRFIQISDRIADEEKPDLMWLDPIAAYAGDDLSKQTTISNFCRDGLDGVAKTRGFAWFVINHFTKPSGDGSKRKGWTSSDHQYRGAGSYDLTGWSRAGITIAEVADKTFQMRFAKRGDCAEATHPNGERTNIVWLRHSAGGVFWEQVDPPEEAEQTQAGERKGGRLNDKERVATMNLHSFCAACKEEGEGLNIIAKRLEVWLSKQGDDLKITTCKRIIPLLVKNGKLAKGEDSLYRKGPNA